MNEHNPAVHHDPEPAHVLPLRTYLGIFALLLVLTGVTTGIAYVDLGFLNTPIALAIASTKALAVILVFMHVRFSGKVVWLFAIGGFLWLVILFAFSMSDYYTRSVISGWGG